LDQGFIDCFEILMGKMNEKKILPKPKVEEKELSFMRCLL